MSSPGGDACFYNVHRKGSSQAEPQRIRTPNSNTFVLFCFSPISNETVYVTHRVQIFRITGNLIPGNFKIRETFRRGRSRLTSLCWSTMQIWSNISAWRILRENTFETSEMCWFWHRGDRPPFRILTIIRNCERSSSRILKESSSTYILGRAIFIACTMFDRFDVFTIKETLVSCFVLMHKELKKGTGIAKVPGKCNKV